jgi:proton-dependent oligopeptide transporter, POT family
MTEKAMTFWEQTKRLQWPFWVVNIMEMFERLAYYGTRVVIPIYIAQANEPGGLHFTQGDKGIIFMVWAVVQSFLPVFTGGFADRYGYKNQIVVAIFLKASGYIMMATQREFWPFLGGVVLLAAGTAVFKPPIQGTMVKTLNEKNSGVGWGYFYQVVNIGGFLGPPLAHFLYGISWPAVFYGCAVMVSLNIFWLLAYKEVDSGADKTKGLGQVIIDTAKYILNAKLIAFMLIASAFWAAFMQLFDMLPNFIVDWTDTSAIAAYVPEFLRGMLLSRDISRGPQIAQEWVINFNPLLIIFFVPFISAFVNKYMRRLSSIFLGFVVASCGVLLAGSSMLGVVCFLGIALFSFGEMLCSPKMHEYLGVIAPPDKKALFMGYANIPVGIGWGYGAIAAGNIYGKAGEKAALALNYMRDHLSVAADQLPDRTVAFATLMEKTGMNASEATKLLWDTYNPSQVWYPFFIAGIASAVALAIFNQFAKKWDDANA